MMVSAAESVRPPERINVAQASEKYRYINNKGSYVGPWKNSTTPYLVEPMEILTSLDFIGMIFVGPSQSGKTDLYVNWHGYTVRVDPADITLIQTSQSTASDFSKRKIDRLHRDSPEVGRRLLPGRNNDNIFDKQYLGGTYATLSWPSINELSGRSIPRMFLTDYDRMDMDVDGNGEPYDLAEARTTVYGRHAMTAAESSPSFPVTDPTWSPSTPHEAPPTEGILKLYNRGDRRRWMWPCASCGHAFEPVFALLRWPDSTDFLECAENAWLECPHCQAQYVHGGKNGLPSKYEMNLRGTWVQDGMTLTPDGELVGKPYRSQIASFWLNGVAASFRNWTTLVSKYLEAEAEYERTGSETSLQATVNTRNGEPYRPKSQEADRLPEEMKNRAKDFGLKTVPPGVRFLVASIDVQKNRFVVQVHGIGVGGDVWVIDRFDVRYSLRPDAAREGQVHFVRPFVEAVDWRVLLREVINKTYPLGDGSGRRMAIKATNCDTGGGEEGTANAYKFYRWLRTGPQEEDQDADEWTNDWSPGLHARFQLIKGRDIGPRVKLSYPDSGRADRHAGARGEIPVWLLNTQALKNQLDSALSRQEEATGRVNFPDWLEIGFYKELCVEVKDPKKGKWTNPKRFRNESWDLMVYQHALCLTPLIKLERIPWTDPPSWADEWDVNELVFEPEEQNPIASQASGDYDLSKLAEALG